MVLGVLSPGQFARAPFDAEASSVFSQERGQFEIVSIEGVGAVRISRQRLIKRLGYETSASSLVDAHEEPVIAVALHFCLGSIVKLAEPSVPAPAVAAVSEPKATEPESDMEKEASGYGGFVKQLVGRQLLDADSAQFSDGRAYRTDKRRSFCGSVNGKNRFGGYVGPQPYVVAADGQVYVGDAATADIILRECQGVESAAFRVW